MTSTAVIIPQFTNNTVNSYVIDYNEVAEVKFVIQESTENKTPMRLFADAILASTQELKKAREDVHSKLSIFKKDGE